MNEVWILYSRRDEEDTVFRNRIGYFGLPPDNIVQLTLHEFFYGLTNLEFHVYYRIRSDVPNWNRFPLLEELFNRYSNFEEYYSETCGHVWYTTIVTEQTGRRHRLRISRGDDDRWNSWTDILIGREETFAERERHYLVQYRGAIRNGDYHPPKTNGRVGKLWKMETAVEPEKEETAVEPEKEETAVEPEKEETAVEPEEERQ